MERGPLRRALTWPRRGGSPDADIVEKLRRLQSVTDAALSRLDVDDLLTELVERTRELLDVDAAAIMLVDPTGTELVATAASGLEEEVRQSLRVPLGAGFVGRVAASAEPVALRQVDAEHVVSKVLLDKGLVSMLGVRCSAATR
jgi:signal transduction protein with GAF and PtsI domain